MSSKKILTIFGSTGNQGGSIIDAVLARPYLQEKWALRGVTRDPNSGKSKALAEKGVEMVKADLNDVEAMKVAIRGSYGVFGVTDFWAVMSKDIEIQQGKNIFAACQAEGVKHYVFSTLPYAEKISNGELKHVDHFDGKAIVKEYCEANKGDMTVSYYKPAMFITFVGGLVKEIDGQPQINLPFPDENIAWPLVEPKRDGGKWVMGLFEGGSEANGVEANGVSTWTTPKDVVAELSKQAGKEVKFNSIPAEVFGSFLPENIRSEMVETMLLVGNYNYFGKGMEKRQQESDKWLVKDADLIDWGRYVKEAGVAAKI